MTIEESVARLEGLAGAVVGFGPKHPVRPNPSIDGRIRSFLSEYPELRRDSCYIEFLEKYAGARLENEDYSQIVNIFGFADVSIDMMETDDAPLVTDGYLPFAQCVYHMDTEVQVDTYEYYFALDVTGAREPGVYRMYSDMHSGESPFSWYCSDFCTWLAEFVEKDGFYERSQ